jgi:manganese/zinc/iron transport system ATP- binding protein
METVLQTTNLTKTFGSRTAVNEVNITAYAGEIFGFLGPNGAGKTTLIKTILGLMKPAAGQVLIYGKPYNDQRRLVGYVPQRGSVDWDFPTSALDVVMMGRYGSLGWIRRPGRSERQAAKEALEKVGMLGFAERQISQLSGGQQQRVFLARALVQDARV